MCPIVLSLSAAIKSLLGEIRSINERLLRHTHTFNHTHRRVTQIVEILHALEWPDTSSLAKHRKNHCSKNHQAQLQWVVQRKSPTKTQINGIYNRYKGQYVDRVWVAINDSQRVHRIFVSSMSTTLSLSSLSYYSWKNSCAIENRSIKCHKNEFVEWRMISGGARIVILNFVL